MSEQTTASVESLTAAVRVLMVGNRQVTLSVARQLDKVPWQDIQPFGRVRISKDDDGKWGTIVGSNSDGDLVIADAPPEGVRIKYEQQKDYPTLCDRQSNVTFAHSLTESERYAVATFAGLSVVFAINRRVSSRNDAHQCRHHDGACGNVLPPSVETWLRDETAKAASEREWWEAHKSLPLIVLAGLR